ncbi:DUF1214 domain-containing protein [Mangrovicoccus ximenensis]|uniref:DUF1214 domain-containing protein n=1 Tax=Mangrovicoccus ximenensis TaxID=1911570 RepID=UPI000D3C5296|nr:DUF1214 domain-containing protein [Mangrovicoccus ximenensis]
MRLSAIIASLLGAALTLVGAAAAQERGGDLRGLLESREVPVDITNFVRAATDIEFEKYHGLAGGVNKLLHIREVTPVERQPTIRMNRDTIYSMVLADISKGATLVLPETGDRYISAQVVNQDHYMNKVFLGGGTYALDMETFTTPYVVIIIRTLADASDPADMAAAHALQDAIALEAGATSSFVVPNYDMDDFRAVLKAALELSRFAPDSRDTFGPEGEVAPLRHFLGAAFGWGGLPETEAYYLNVDPGLPVGAYKIEVPADVPVGAFWSVSLYNADGFYQKNALGAYNVNSVSGTRNDDGGMTIHLGGCDDGRQNCLPVMEGWNYVVRLYRPGTEVLDGSWSFPGVAPM